MVRRSKRFLILLFVSAVCMAATPNRPTSIVSPSYGPMGPPAPPPVLKRVLGPSDYHRLAWQDSLTLDPITAKYSRWLTNPDHDPVLSMKTDSLTLCYLNRGEVILRPLPVAGGALVRVDLRLWWPGDKDLAEALALWEEFAFDPYLNTLLTKDTVQFAADRAEAQAFLAAAGLADPRLPIVGPPAPEWRTETKVIHHPGGDYAYPDDTGRVARQVAAGEYEVTLRFRTGGDPGLPTGPPVGGKGVGKAAVDVTRLDPVHSDLTFFQELSRRTGSLAPVVDHRYFKFRALNTVKRKAVYKAVFGGLYYELRGIRRAKDVLGKDTKVTDLDLFFHTFGIGNIKAGENVDQFLKRVPGDLAVAVFRSGVTAKPREAFGLHVPLDRRGRAYGVITGDVTDADVDVGDNPVANLLKPRRKAREGLFPGVTSALTFTLFDGDGGLQDVAPADVVDDSEIPSPHTKELQGAISCLRCHFVHGEEGWKPIGNDVKKMLDGRLDLAGDLGAGFKFAFSPETVTRLAGRYYGTLDDHLMFARMDASRVTLQATGPWPGVDPTRIAQAAHKHLAGEYAAYWYEPVDARTALLECGYDVPTELAAKVLTAMAPPSAALAAQAGAEPPFQVPGIIPEDPVVYALKKGISVNRATFAPSFSFLCQRVDKTAARNLKEGKTWYGTAP